ncbi:MAG: DEAD/DEAH box helicase [Anaerolineae bacterium]|nr:DEAD/DEAH box helicase [Anaerolineae bacterium]
MNSSHFYSILFPIVLQVESFPAFSQLTPNDKDTLKIKALAFSTHAKPEQQIDVAIALYLADHLVMAERAVIKIETVDLTLIGQWLLMFFRHNFLALDNKIAEIQSDLSYTDANIAEQIQNLLITEDQAIDRIVERCLAESFKKLLACGRTGEKTLFDECDSKLLDVLKFVLKSHRSDLVFRLSAVRRMMYRHYQHQWWVSLQNFISNETDKLKVTQFINKKIDLNRYELWPSQIQTISLINAPYRDGFVVCLPPSSGKTTVAEMTILRFLMDYPADNSLCVYVAPLRVLAQEVEENLRNIFGSHIASRFYSDWGLDYFDDDVVAKARVLVCTPEKLDALIRQSPDMLKLLRLVIFDEGHKIGEKGDRGILYRRLVERLVYRLEICKDLQGKKYGRTIMLSGVIPDQNQVHELAKLISGNSMNCASGGWRPLDPPVIEKFYWDDRKKRFSPRTKWNISTQEFESQPSYMINSFPAQCNSFGLQPRELAILQLAIESTNDGAVLIFAPSKQWMESKSGRKYQDALACLRTARDISYDSNRSSLCYDHPDPEIQEIYDLTKQGVGFCHADIPSALRDEIIKLIRTDGIRLVFGNTTLAEGVNLPISRIIVLNLKITTQNFSEPNFLEPTTFWNLVGRVGRPNNNSTFSPASIIFVEPYENNLESKHIAKLIQNQSHLAISPSIKFLLEIRQQWENSGKSIQELLESLAQNALIPNHSPDLSKFLKKLDGHFIALLEENKLIIKQDQQIENFTSELFGLMSHAAFVPDADKEFIKEAIKARAKYVVNKLPALARKARYTSGLSPESIEILEKNKSQILDLLNIDTEIAAQDMIGLANKITKLTLFCRDLPDCKFKVRTKNIGKEPVKLNLQALSDFLNSWLIGENQAQVVSKFNQIYKKTTAKPVYFEDYQDSMLEQVFPFVVSMLIRYMKVDCEANSIALSASLDMIPSFIRIGSISRIVCALKFLMPHLQRDNLNNLSQIVGSKISTEEWHSTTTPQDYGFLALSKLSESELSQCGFTSWQLDIMVKKQEEYEAIKDSEAPEFSEIF